MFCKKYVPLICRIKTILSTVCQDSVLQCSIRTIENCSNLCAVLFSDLCHCSATQYTPSLTHDSVHLTVSLLEDVLAGQ